MRSTKFSTRRSTLQSFAALAAMALGAAAVDVYRWHPNPARLTGDTTTAIARVNDGSAQRSMGITPRSASGSIAGKSCSKKARRSLLWLTIHGGPLT